MNHIHDIAIAHLRIPNDVRVSIASKLQNGVPVDTILDQVLSHTLGREHLINIQTQFNIDGIQMIPRVCMHG